MVALKRLLLPPATGTFSPLPRKDGLQVTTRSPFSAPLQSFPSPRSCTQLTREGRRPLQSSGLYASAPTERPQLAKQLLKSASSSAARHVYSEESLPVPISRAPRASALQARLRLLRSHRGEPASPAPSEAAYFRGNTPRLGLRLSPRQRPQSGRGATLCQAPSLAVQIAGLLRLYSVAVPKDWRGGRGRGAVRTARTTPGKTERAPPPYKALKSAWLWLDRVLRVWRESHAKQGRDPGPWRSVGGRGARGS